MITLLTPSDVQMTRQWWLSEWATTEHVTGEFSVNINVKNNTVICVGQKGKPRYVQQVAQVSHFRYSHLVITG